MKTMIAGSRKIVDTTLLTEAIIASGFTITKVVSGMAHGVDRMGQAWAAEHGIPIKHFPPTGSFMAGVPALSGIEKWPIMQMP